MNDVIYEKRKKITDILWSLTTIKMYGLFLYLSLLRFYSYAVNRSAKNQRRRWVQREFKIVLPKINQILHTPQWRYMPVYVNASDKFNDFQRKLT